MASVNTDLLCYMSRKYYTNERNVQIVLSVLKANGIKKVIASPGTTNITLVASMQQDSWFEVYSSVDERSAAYMACGMSAESGEPVVLSCTGATASRNYMSGLTEAYYRKLPILAITSNQGPGRVGHLVAQNIDRTCIPNDIAVCSVHVPTVKDKEDEWYCTTEVNRAVLELTRRGGGPVHINLSTTYSDDFSVTELPETRIVRRITAFDARPAMPKGRIAVFIGSHKRWTQKETEALDSFCSTHNAVAFCDHTSGYKGKYRVLFSLVSGQVEYWIKLRKLDLLIHIGEVSGDYYSLALSAAQVWRVSEDGDLKDTVRRLTHIFEMPEVHFFRKYSEKLQPGSDTYLKECRAKYTEVYNKMPDIPFSNIKMAKYLAPKLPAGCQFHLGILNSLRSWNFFEIPESVESFCNVGGFGIDGNLSALIGSALVNPDKLYLAVLGDLAFFYDMNSLGNRHLPKNIRILLINNGRGTEFRNYGHKGHKFGEAADPYIAAAGHYGNKSNALVRHYAEDLGFEYATATNMSEFEQVAEKFVSPTLTGRPLLLEVFTDSVDESNALEITRNYMRIDLATQKEAKKSNSLIGKIFGKNK